MVALYSRAFASVRHLWRLYLFTTMAIIALDMLSNRAVSLGSFLVGTVFAYEIHRFFLLGKSPVLLGKRPKGPRPERMLGFFCVTAVLLVVPFALAIAGFAMVAEGASSGVHILALVIGAIVVGFLFYWVFLMTFGTALPAAAAGDRFGLALTLRRARHTFHRIGWGLLYGPGLFGTVGLGAALLMPYAMGHFSENPPADPITAFGILTGLAFQLYALVTTTLAIIVLCDAYRGLADIPELGGSIDGN